MAHETFISYILEYHNPTHTFSESPTRTRHFATRAEMTDFIEGMDIEEKVLKSFKQVSRIEREYYIGR